MDLFNLMTIKEFAKLLQKTESTVRTWKRRGVIPAECFKVIGTAVYVKIDEAKKFLAA